MFDQDQNPVLLLCQCLNLLDDETFKLVDSFQVTETNPAIKQVCFVAFDQAKNFMGELILNYDVVRTPEETCILLIFKPLQDPNSKFRLMFEYRFKVSKDKDLSLLLKRKDECIK